MIYACRDKPVLQVKEKVAVVLLAYNSRSFLKQFIPFVLKTDYPDHRLIIVDNASTDDTADFLKQEYPDIDVLRIDINKGFTNGFVESLACIKAEYYALLTSDVEVPPGWLTPLVRALDEDKKLGACQPKIKAFKQRD
ncbi:glycosyltransferase, partial [bacterium]|nr:glycosyltransferase [candidate division CSSED10-310 bacterium]